MSIVCRRFGLDFGKWMRQQDTRLIYDAKDILNEMEKMTQVIVLFGIDYLYPRSNATKDIDRWRNHTNSLINRMRATLSGFYDRLGGLAHKNQKAGFSEGRKQIEKLFRTLYPTQRVKTPIREELIINKYTPPEVILNPGGNYVELSIGTGKISDEFKIFLQKQFNNKEDPRTLIKTLTDDHVKQLRKTLIMGVEARKDLPLVRDEFVGKLFKDIDDSKIMKQMEYNVMRIMRTSFQRASNASISQFSANNGHIVKYMVRVANGRPCLACISLEGKRYPIGATLDDHPNGMCSLAPVIMTPEELGLSKKNISKVGGREWGKQKRDYPLYKDRFDKLSDREKQMIFGNQKLFDLSKKEKLPLDFFVNKKSGTVISYKDAVVKLINQRKVA